MEEFKKAFKKRENEILITNIDLAERVIIIIKINKLSFFALTTVVASFAIGVALTPINGEIPFLTGLGLSATVAGLSGQAIVVIIDLSFLGIVVLHALYRDYEIIVTIDFDSVSKKYKAKFILTRKQPQMAPT